LRSNSEKQRPPYRAAFAFRQVSVFLRSKDPPPFADAPAAGERLNLPIGQKNPLAFMRLFIGSFEHSGFIVRISAHALAFWLSSGRAIIHPKVSGCSMCVDVSQTDLPGE
jgi:hypothetical protein